MNPDWDGVMKAQSRAPAPTVLPVRRKDERSAVVRWVEHLTDTQVVELTHRLWRASQDSPDIEPERLRDVLIRFAQEMP